VMVEVNQLGELLRTQRFDRVDARSLLRQVLQEVDVAIFTFDEDRRLRLVNDAGERLMAQPAERLVGRTAADLGLDRCLDAEPAASLETSFPGQTGRWQVHQSRFREAGAPAHLLLLTDLSKALRDEERQAWQRLIRVLGHELNNSLAPIKSTATTLSSILRRDDPHKGWRNDAQRGLSMIADRCEALNRFVVAYSKLARLPAPQLRPVALGPLVRRVASMESRCPVHVDPGPEITLTADADQLEQLLINLVKNAGEAATETAGEVRMSWSGSEDRQGGVEVRVTDTGPGLMNTSNLFVPFFTTKPGCSCIGLVLCRQIAEAHGGSLELDNRRDGISGCVASLRLPGSDVKESEGLG